MLLLLSVINTDPDFLCCCCLLEIPTRTTCVVICYKYRHELLVLLFVRNTDKTDACNQ